MTSEPQDLSELGASLRAHALRYTAPTDLAESIRAELTRPAGEHGATGAADRRPRRVDRSRRLRTGLTRGVLAWLGAGGQRLAMCFALGLVAGVLLVQSLTTAPVNDEARRELVSAHVRSLLAAHLVDVDSSDQHTVKPWFNGRLDFAPPVRDLAAQGFPLSGGRLDVLQGRPVAALVYRYQKHIINLFVWPAEDAAPANLPLTVQQAERGYQVVGWRSEGLDYRSVSDASAETVARFSEYVRHGAPSTP